MVSITGMPAQNQKNGMALTLDDQQRKWIDLKQKNNRILDIIRYP
jgi:hypothetical protein